MTFNLRVKSLLLAGLLDLVLAAGIGYSIFQVSQSRFRASFLEQKLDQIESVARLIDGDVHATFVDRVAVQHPEYQRYLASLNRILQKQDYIRYLYTLNYDAGSGGFTYAVDAGIATHDTVWIESDVFALVLTLDEQGALQIQYDEQEYSGGLIVDLEGEEVPLSLRPDGAVTEILLGGETLSGDAIQKLRERLLNNDLAHGDGGYRQHDIAGEYLTRIVSDVKLARPMKIIIDCGNGVPGAFAPKLYRDMGCQVEELFCEVDGNFPNHHPDPSQPKNLQDLIAALKTSDAEIGLAFDGDGDRLGVVTKDGSIIFPDRQLMLFADDVLSRNPGAEIIFDVKSTRNLFNWIRERGGRPLLWKTGHSFIKAKMKETGALLAGEMSGHVFFKERWYGFDDGLYAGARLLEYLSKQADINATLHGLPDTVNTPELNIKMAEGEHYALMDTLQKTAHFPGAREVITIDGLRVEYADGFGLARPSNTTPVIVLRFEADSASALERIQADFRRVIHETAPGLSLPF